MQHYAGMTVNERLYASGRLKDFDQVRKSKNKARMTEILKSLDVDTNSISKNSQTLWN